MAGRSHGLAIGRLQPNSLWPRSIRQHEHHPDQLPYAGGSGCQGEVARYCAVMSNDLAMGHVNQSVSNRVEKEIEQAENACSTGHDAEAQRMIHATKARHGYL